MKTVELSEENIDLILMILTKRNEELTDLLKQQDLEDRTIRDMQLEQRDLNDIIRELVHYSETKK